mmetsp:Transcript_7759/g.27259  ORF Transcript_7759/g.27259 Transcript_7759/m.27259 type:complete len:196 (-) Transcript_7759:387-974(-)
MAWDGRLLTTALLEALGAPICTFGIVQAGFAGMVLWDLKHVYGCSSVKQDEEMSVKFSYLAVVIFKALSMIIAVAAAHPRGWKACGKVHKIAAAFNAVMLVGRGFTVMLLFLFLGIFAAGIDQNDECRCPTDMLVTILFFGVVVFAPYEIICFLLQLRATWILACSHGVNGEEDNPSYALMSDTDITGQHEEYSV